LSSDVRPRGTLIAEAVASESTDLLRLADHGQEQPVRMQIPPREYMLQPDGIATPDHLIVSLDGLAMGLPNGPEAVVVVIVDHARHGLVAAAPRVLHLVRVDATVASKVLVAGCQCLKPHCRAVHDFGFA
jgi:hypothetical protein